MFCPQCGTGNDSNSNFCKQCGCQIGNVSVGGPGGGSRPVQAPPPPKKGCCSCSSIMFGCAFFFFVIFGFLAYTIYSGPQFMAKFMETPEIKKAEMSAYIVSEDDAKKFDNILSEFQKYISTSDKPIMLVFKESELNSKLNQMLPIPLDAKKESVVQNVKIKLLPDGVKIMGIIKLVKLESFFELNGKILVANSKFDINLTQFQLGSVNLPISVINPILNEIKKKQDGQGNKLTFGNVKCAVNKLGYEEGKVSIELVKAQ